VYSIADYNIGVLGELFKMQVRETLILESITLF
jgi:hypothetical protein